MPDTIVGLPRFNVGDGNDRPMAVQAALELLRAYCLGGNSSSATEPAEFFDKLSDYADKIQAATRKP